MLPVCSSINYVYAGVVQFCGVPAFVIIYSFHVNKINSSLQFFIAVPLSCFGFYFLGKIFGASARNINGIIGVCKIVNKQEDSTYSVFGFGCVSRKCDFYFFFLLKIHFTYLNCRIVCQKSYKKRRSVVHSKQKHI